MRTLFGKKNTAKENQNSANPIFDMPPPPALKEQKSSWRMERVKSGLKTGLTPTQVEEYKRAFDHFDADGSGDLTIDEIKDVLQTQGMDMSLDEVDDLVKDIDADGNGTIDFPEFLAAMARRAASKAHIGRLQRSVERVITLQKHTLPTFLPLQASDPRFELAEAQRQKAVDKIIQEHAAQQDDMMKRTVSATVLKSKSKAVMARNMKTVVSGSFRGMLPHLASESETKDQVAQGEAASIAKALSTKPVTKESEDSAVTTYSAFDTHNIKLFCPTTPELVSQIPQIFCIQADPSVRFVNVIDQNFQAIKSLTRQPEHSNDEYATFFGTVTIPASCTKVFLCSRGHVEDRVKYEVYCHYDIVGLIEFSAKHSSLEQSRAEMHKFHEEKDYKTAIHHAQVCLYFEPRDCEALACELQCYHALGNHKLAVETADTLLDMSKTVLAAHDPIRKSAFEIRATTSFLRGFPEQCHFTCVEGLMTFPDSEVLAQYQALSSSDTTAIATGSNTSLWTWVDQDAHALATPASVCDSVLSLATHLAKPFTKEVDKVRAFFRWICENIEYDGDGLRFGTYAEADLSPDGVIQTRKAVCQGYVNLFKAMCDAVQSCECVVLLGFGKAGFLDLGDMQVPNHAWNAFRIDDTWHLVDVTWAAGTLQADFSFRKDFNNYFWMTPPHQFILSHFPEDPDFQLLNQVRSIKGARPVSSADGLTKADFASALTLSSHVFDTGLEMVSHTRAIINVASGDSVDIVIRETKPDTLFLFGQIKSLDGSKIMPWDVDVDYDAAKKTHTLMVDTSGENAGSYALEIFYSEEESGMYTALVEYRLDVEA